MHRRGDFLVGAGKTGGWCRTQKFSDSRPACAPLQRINQFLVKNWKRSKVSCPSEDCSLLFVKDFDLARQLTLFQFDGIGKRRDFLRSDGVPDLARFCDFARYDRFQAVPARQMNDLDGARTGIFEQERLSEYRPPRRFKVVNVTVLDIYRDSPGR